MLIIELEPTDLLAVFKQEIKDLLKFHKLQFFSFVIMLFTRVPLSSGTKKKKTVLPILLKKKQKLHVPFFLKKNTETYL